jgi:hypothetical protein
MKEEEPDLKEKILKLHQAFELLTGNKSTLGFERERQWFEWLRFREQEPFCEEDLSMVIGWIIKEYKKGTRGSLAGLRFSVLIGYPAEFEDMLNQIKAEQRARKRPTPIHELRRNWPATIPETNHSRHVSEIVKESNLANWIEEMRKAVG